MKKLSTIDKLKAKALLAWVGITVPIGEKSAKNMKEKSKKDLAEAESAIKYFKKAKIKIKKYNKLLKKQGWFFHSPEHRLARYGIKTGRKKK